MTLEEMMKMTNRALTFEFLYHMLYFHKEKTVVILNIPMGEVIIWGKGEEFLDFLIELGYFGMMDDEKVLPFIFNFDDRHFLADKIYINGDEVHIVIEDELPF